MDSNSLINIYTPAPGDLSNQGSPKLLVAIFIIDASRTMENGRISAVNNALQELKYQLSEIQGGNNLDLRVAIMSFTSSARWEVDLTPIDELNFNGIQTRPGLTQYGAAFRELNKVLDKEHFLKYSGKVAPPAIMFLTDGEPDDDYSHYLNDLLNNDLFAGASRSAVLIGDAIYNDSARQAVARFVQDKDKDIVAAEDSTMIIQNIKLATLHTLTQAPLIDLNDTNQNPAHALEPDPNPNHEPESNPGLDPFLGPEPNPGLDPFPELGDYSFENNQNPFGDDPFSD